MKPRRPERSAVWQRTRLRPVAEPEESAPAVARSAATPLRPNLLMALYSTEARAVSSAGRAPALHAGGRRFDPVTAHTPPSASSQPPSDLPSSAHGDSGG